METPTVPELEELTLETYRLRLIAFGVLTLLTFDVLLNLRAEIAYVWRGSWSLFKILYLISRYASFVIPCLVIVPAHTPKFCVGYAWYMFSGTMLLGIFPSECLFAIRLDRLYTSKIFRWILILLAIAEAVAYTILVVLNAREIKSKIIPLASSVGSNCLPFKAPHRSLILGLGVPSFVIAVLYCCFAVAAFYKHIDQRKNFINHRFLRESGTLAPILIVLFRDGIVCYILCTGGYLAGLILYSVYSQSLLINVAPMVVVLSSSTITSRLVLVLKGDPGYATGIYRAGNDLLIKQDGRMEEYDSSMRAVDDELRVSNPDFMLQIREDSLSIPMNVL